ncbi:MAG: hypothetical protein GWN58_04650 [Anaerolineae bacterium]|nr:hypothetical protein [Anaerolineae bacterium]
MHYKKSAAVVWALKRLEDDDSCLKAKRKYERKHGPLTPTIDYAIETTYRDIMGVCDANDPRREARRKARSYLD